MFLKADLYTSKQVNLWNAYLTTFERIEFKKQNDFVR